MPTVRLLLNSFVVCCDKQTVRGEGSSKLDTGQERFSGLGEFPRVTAFCAVLEGGDRVRGLEQRLEMQQHQTERAGEIIAEMNDPSDDKEGDIMQDTYEKQTSLTRFDETYYSDRSLAFNARVSSVVRTLE